MADKKAYPVAGQPPTGYVPAPPQPAYPGAAAYGVFPSQAPLYAPPPSYEQTLPQAQAQAAANQQMYAQMYAQAAQAQAQAAQAQAQGYPGNYLGYPAGYMPAAYYPSLAYSYPGLQQAQMRQTIMVPGGFDGGARFDGMSAAGIPAAPPGVAPNAAQLAAMAGHNVALTQKKGGFLTGASDGGYTFW